MTIQITEDNFQSEVLESPVPVFVDCYADWCAPCRALKPLLTAIEEDNQERVKLALLDIDSHPNLAVRLKVTSIPKVVIFHKGEEVTSISGVHGKEDYQDAIDGL